MEERRSELEKRKTIGRWTGGRQRAHKEAYECYVRCGAGSGFGSLGQGVVIVSMKEGSMSLVLE